MTLRQFLKTIGSCAALAVVVLVGMSITSPRGQAYGDNNGGKESEIRQGFAIAPVPLNLDGKNRALVGLGSYLVNAVADCNGCHGPLLEFAPGGDPYQGQPKHINQQGYLAGGNPLFGPFFLPRNLTPDKTGRPEGGASD